ncbi:MAG: hypothetical protein ACOZNI_34980 [Myxococcota bacterium]
MTALLLAVQLVALASAHGGGHEHAPDASDATSTPLPATYAEVVDALRTGQTDASRAVAEGRLSDLHALARTISDLAVAAPVRAAGVPGMDRATVAFQALEIKEAAEALHHAGDEGDAAGAVAALDRMTRPLIVLSAM